MKTSLWAAAGLLMGIAVAEAQEEPSPLWATALQNLSREYVTCAAYFTTVALGAERSDNQELADKYYAAASVAMTDARLAGEEVSLTAEILQPWFERDQVELRQQIGGDIGNLPVLIRQYSDPCIAAVGNFEGRLTHWIDKELTGTTGGRGTGD